MIHVFYGGVVLHTANRGYGHGLEAKRHNLSPVWHMLLQDNREKS